METRPRQLHERAVVLLIKHNPAKAGLCISPKNKCKCDYARFAALRFAGFFAFFAGFLAALRFAGFLAAFFAFFFAGIFFLINVKEYNDVDQKLLYKSYTSLSYI